MKKTKIVATLGPASSSKEVLKEMVFNTQKKDESNLLKEDNIRDLGE